MKNVVLAGAGDALGRRLTADLRALGLEVFAGYAGGPQNAREEKAFFFDPTDIATLKSAAQGVGMGIDMLVVNIDGGFAQAEGSILDGADYEALLKAYDYNTLGALRVINAFLPLLEKGTGKRICIVTTQESSNNLCTAAQGFTLRVSSAPLNMAATQLFNALRPEGYTFRMYAKDPQGLHDEWAAEYFTRNRSYESWDLKHSDEERIVLRNHMARELPW